MAGGYLTSKYKKGKPLPAGERSKGAKVRYFNERGWRVHASASFT